MPFSGPGPFLGAQADTAYQVSRSLRFRSSATAYLNRTPASAGDRQKWTWSAWVKRGSLTVSANSLYMFDASASGIVENPITFNSSDKLELWAWNGSGYDYRVETTQVFRDPSSWYHIVVSVNTTSSTTTINGGSSDRVRIYVNGLQISAFSAVNVPTQNYNTAFNTTNAHNIGRSIATSARFYDGYLSEVNFIDGQALTPSSFGAFDTNGVWQPKAYTGTYGTNGFYLPFTNNSSAPNLGYDYSPGSYSLNLREAGTNIGNMTDSGGLAGAFDGIVNNAAASANKVNGTDNSATPKIGGYVGKDWGSGNTKTITGFIFRTPTGEWVNNQTTGTTITITLQGSSDNSTWTDLGSGTFTDVSTGTSLVKSTGLTATAYRYHRIKIESSGTFNGGGCRCGELELYESGSYGLNSWQVNNISLATGTTYDSMIDSPTNYADGGNGRGNYAVLNPVNGSTNASITEGNLSATGTTANYASNQATFNLTSGKWYFEMTKATSTANVDGLGLVVSTYNKNSTLAGDTGSYIISDDNPSQIRTKSNGGASVTVSTTNWANNDVIQCAYDADSGKVWFGRNGSWYPATNGGTVGNPAAGTNPTITAVSGLTPIIITYNTSSTNKVNFGQRPFAYTPPSGFSALNTQNLPAPALTPSP